MADNLFQILQDAWTASSTGEAKVFGVEVALVTDVKDPDKQGRVKICYPRFPGKPESDWARVAQPAAGPGRGFYWLPEVNDEVLVAFERGEAHKPYVVGALWNGKDAPMKDAYQDENTTRMIQSKSGHQILLSDKDGEETITIGDKSGKRTITFDVKNKKLLFEAGTGDIELKAEKKIILECEDLEIKTKKTGKLDIGDSFDLVVKDKSGFKAGPTLEIKADKVEINPSGGAGFGGLAAMAWRAAKAAAAAAASAAIEGQGAAAAASAAAGAAASSVASDLGGGDLASDVAPPSAGSSPPADDAPPPTKEAPDAGAGGDSPPADNPPADNPPADNPPADNPPADNPPADNPPADNPPADNPPADNPPADNPPADNPPVDNPPADNPPADNPPADNPPADNPPTDNPPLAQGSEVAVNVVDGAGAPVDGAQVKLQASDGSEQTQTTAAGTADFQSVPAGDCTITVDKDGFASATSSTSVTDGTSSSVSVTLTANQAPLTVFVKDSSGNPLSGATVTVDGGALGSASLTTDGSGQATSGPLAIGDYQVTAALDNFNSPDPVQVTLSPQATNTATVTLTPVDQPLGNELVVSVTDSLGAAIDGAEVKVTASDQSEQTQTTAGGQVTFKDLPVGACTITASKDGFDPGSASAAIPDGGSTTASIQLTANRAAFTVLVKNDAGTPLSGAAVTIDGAGAGGVSLQTDDSGVADAGTLPVGDYQVSAALDNHTSPAPVTVSINATASNQTTVTLTPDAITASFTPTPLTVVVAKGASFPARKKLTLQTAGPAFKGVGRLTVSKPSLRFFDADLIGTEIVPGADLDGGQLTAGLDLWVEGATASDADQDIDLSLDLFIGKNHFGQTAAGKATAVELTLDLYLAPAAAGADPVKMSDADKNAAGRFVHLQAAGHHSRAQVVVREAKPASFSGSLVLDVAKTGGGDVALLNTDASGATVAPAEITAAALGGAGQIDGAKGVAFFVEGSAVSTGLRDVALLLGIKGDTPEGDRVSITVFQVSQIDLSVPNTLCNRTGTATAPVLKSSVTDTEVFAANDGDMVLLKGSGDVDFAATVAPAGIPLSWAAAQATDDAGPQGAPTVTPDVADPAKIKLTCDAEGSFHVSAFVDQKGDPSKRGPGDSGLIFNLHLVNCQVQTGAADTKNVTNDLRSGAVSGGRLSIDTGTANLPAAGYGDAELAKWAFGAKTTVKVTGGGADQLRGISKAGMGYIQDVVADSFMGTYKDNKTEKEVLTTLPMPAGLTVGGTVTSGALPLLAFPTRDHKNPGRDGYNTFINGTDDSDRDADKITWRVRMIDSPAVSVHTAHPTSNSALDVVAGSNDFQIYCAGFSKDFPECYVVVSEATWSADYGSWDPGTTSWKNTGNITSSGMTTHDPPVRADSLGLEHCPPAYTETYVMDAR